MAGTDPATQNQNLINPSKIDTSVRPQGFWRSIILDAVSVIAAALFGYSYYRYLTLGSSLWFVLAAMTFFGTAAVIQVFLAKKSGRRILVILLETIATLGWFWYDNPMIMGITAGILLVMLVWGYVSARMLVKNSVEVPFFGASGNVLGKLTTGVLLFMILIYVPRIGGNALVVSRQGFGTFFDWTSGLVNNFYPGLTLNGTFGDFAQSFTKMELANNPSFQSLNTAQKNAAVTQTTQQLVVNFTASSSSPVATSTPTSDAFYSMLNGVLSAWQSQSSGWFDLGWVVILFIGLRALGVVFVWFAQFVSLIFYEILIASGFMKVMEETRTQETVSY